MMPVNGNQLLSESVIQIVVVAQIICYF